MTVAFLLAAGSLLPVSLNIPAQTSAGRLQTSVKRSSGQNSSERLIPGADEVWRGLLLRAMSRYQRKTLQSALTLYARALQAAEQSRDLRGMAIVEYYLGREYGAAGNITEAIRACQKSGEWFRAANSPRDLLMVHSELGVLHFYAQDYEQARTQAQRCVDLAASLREDPKPPGELPDEYGLANAFSTLGALHQRAGEIAQAAELLGRSLSLWRRLNGSGHRYDFQIADGLKALADVYAVTGEHQQALVCFQQALEVAAKLPQPDRTASILVSLGALYLEQEEYAQSADCFQRSLQLYRTLGSSREAVKNLLNLGLIAQRQGNYEQAVPLLTRSLAEATTIPDRDVMLAAQIGLSFIQSERGDHAAALAMLDRSLKLVKVTEEEQRYAEILWRRAEVFLALKNYAEAAPLANSAYQLAKRLKLPRLAYQTAVTLSRCRVALNDRSHARETLLNAIGQIENLRARIIGGAAEQQAFLEARRQAHHLLIELSLAQETPVDALLTVERMRSRILLDLLHGDHQAWRQALTPAEREGERQLQQIVTRLRGELRHERLKVSSQSARLSELQNGLEAAQLKVAAFQDLLSARHGERPSSVRLPSLTRADLRELIPDQKTALLEYVVTREQTWLFVMTRSGANEPEVKVWPLNLTETQLRQHIAEFQRLVSQRLPLYAAKARALYDLLLGPVQSQIRDKETLCIIPDGILWEVPFQALQHAEHHFLIEEHALHYAPSLTALREIFMRQTRKSPTNLLLAFGNPTTETELLTQFRVAARSEPFAPLPEAETEVQTIAAMTGTERARVRIGPQADEAAFKAAAASADIIHLATHGVLDNRHPLNSYLLLAKSADGEDGLLEAHEILSLRLQAELVVLSACETARGRIGGGEGVLGLSWAFLAAGSRTMVVSQWAVNSGSTSELMIRFHRHLLTRQTEQKAASGSGVSKAAAMRQAMLEMLRQERWQHPFYWAGFVVIGSNQ